MSALSDGGGPVKVRWAKGRDAALLDVASSSGLTGWWGMELGDQGCCGLAGVEPSTSLMPRP